MNIIFVGVELCTIQNHRSIIKILYTNVQVLAASHLGYTYQFYYSIAMVYEYII